MLACEALELGEVKLHLVRAKTFFFGKTAFELTFSFQQTSDISRRRISISTEPVNQ
jgi:hypothetical protein